MILGLGPAVILGWIHGTGLGYEDLGSIHGWDLGWIHGWDLSYKDLEWILGWILD